MRPVQRRLDGPGRRRSITALSQGLVVGMPISAQPSHRMMAPVTIERRVPSNFVESHALHHEVDNQRLHAVVAEAPPQLDQRDRGE